MKVLAILLAACLVMSVYCQAGVGTTGGASGTGAGAATAGLLGRGGLLGGNMMGLAAMSGQFGDGMQRMARCQLLGLPVILCMTM